MIKDQITNETTAFLFLVVSSCSHPLYQLAYQYTYCILQKRARQHPIHACGCYTCVQSFIDSICQRKLDLDFGQRRLIIPNPNILFALKSQTIVTNSVFCATCQQLLWLLLCQTLIVIFIRYQPPNTPECDHASEQEQEHLHHLQMTDPDHCCAHRQSNTPLPVLPIPQPNFGQPIFVQVSTKTTFTIVVLLMSLTQPSQFATCVQHSRVPAAQSPTIPHLVSSKHCQSLFYMLWP